MILLEAKALGKKFQNVSVLDNISLQLEPGQIFGLFGPDGAGKSTLLKIFCGLLKPDKGELWLKGQPAHGRPALLRQQVGYMPQRFSLYQDLTVAENLDFFCDLFQVPKASKQHRLNQVYEFSYLSQFSDRRAGALSGGMKQKLALSCILVGEPQILLLDEPTTGVDPVSRQQFWDLLVALAKEGRAIFVSTPYLEEGAYCDKLGLLLNGKMLRQGTREEVVGKGQSLEEVFLGLMEGTS